MTDKEIKDLEEKLLNRIENPLGKVMFEVAQRFDTIKEVVQDFKKKVPKNILMSEFEKEIRWLYNNYKLDMNDKEMSRAIDINNLIVDMVHHDKIYEETFLTVYNELKKEEVNEEKTQEIVDHAKIVEMYEKMREEHPEYNERRLLEEVFSSINKAKEWKELSKNLPDELIEEKYE